MPENKINSSLEEQKSLALEIGKYYYKGFGATLDGLIANAELFVLRPERNDLKDMSYEWLGKFDSFYSKIPFDSLQGKEEFYPLFIMKRLLPILRNKVDEHYAAPSQKGIDKMLEAARAITYVGLLYDETFHKILDEIRTSPEEKDFRVRLIDHRGREWNF